jgi:transcriptional regulator, MerR family
MIRQIRSLLYEQGYTIGGARVHLAGDDVKMDSTRSKQLIHQMISELEELLELLK